MPYMFNFVTTNTNYSFVSYMPYMSNIFSMPNLPNYFSMSNMPVTVVESTTGLAVAAPVLLNPQGSSIADLNLGMPALQKTMRMVLEETMAGKIRGPGRGEKRPREE